MCNCGRPVTSSAVISTSTGLWFVHKNQGQAVITWSLSGVCPRHSISSAAAPGPASFASGTSLTKSSSISLSLLRQPAKRKSQAPLMTTSYSRQPW